MNTISAGDMEVLEFARESLRWTPGKRADVVLTRWGYSLTRHDQRLNHIIDLPEAERYDPATVRRLRRLRTARQAQRSSRREGWAR